MRGHLGRWLDLLGTLTPLILLGIVMRVFWWEQYAPVQTWLSR